MIDIDIQISISEISSGWATNYTNTIASALGPGSQEWLCFILTDGRVVLVSGICGISMGLLRAPGPENVSMLGKSYN